MTEISQALWLDGRLVTGAAADPSVASGSLHLGVAVFDGLMAYWNGDRWNLHCGLDHMRRFRTGSDRMDLVTRWSAEQLVDAVHELLATLPRRTHYIRPISYRAGPEVFFEVGADTTSVCIFAVPVGRDDDRPVSCALSDVVRVDHHAIPATWKVAGAYVNSYLCEQRAQAAGFDTGLMLDRHGRIAEASRSNVLFVGDDVVVTPRLDGDVFPGITRALLLDLAATRGVEVQERDIYPDELSSFDAAVVCGTLSEVRPIGRIGSRDLRSVTHPLVGRLVADFRDVTHS